MKATTYVFQYLDSRTPEQLKDDIYAGKSLLAELMPHERMVRAAKLVTTIEVDKKELLGKILLERPEHGKILWANRAWYERQMEEIKAWIDKL